MISAYCLVDFFNIEVLPKSRMPNTSDIRNGLDGIVSATMQALDSLGKPVQELTLRLYGGWHGDFGGTEIQLMDMTMKVIREYPRHIGTRLRVQIADSPFLDPSVQFLHTVRSVPLKVPRAFFTMPSQCANRHHCAMEELVKWWEGKCPDENCTVKLMELGTMVRQKMVDTHITADAVALAAEGSCDILLIASDDDDMVPALLGASGRVTTYHLARKSRRHEYYTNLLQQKNIITHHW